MRRLQRQYLNPAPFSALRKPVKKYYVWDNIINDFDLRIGTTCYRSFFLRATCAGVTSAIIGDSAMRTL